MLRGNAYKTYDDYTIPSTRFHTLKTVFSLVVVAGFVCFAIIPVIVIALSEGNVQVDELSEQVVEMIPFGWLIQRIAKGAILSILGIWTGISNERSIYEGIDVVLSFSIVLQNLLKGIFAITLFEAIRMIVNGLFGLRYAYGLLGTGVRLLLAVTVAMFAVYIAPKAMGYISVGVESAGGWMCNLASTRLPVEFMDVGSLLLIFLIGILLVKFAFLMILKMLVMGAVRLCVAHALALTVLVGMQYQQYMPQFEGFAALFVIVVILGGIELALDSVVWR